MGPFASNLWFQTRAPRGANGWIMCWITRRFTP
jgi:hypothetical protein